MSSDKKIYIEDYAFTYINSIAYNNPSDSQAGVLLGENQTDGDEKCVFIKGIIKAKLGTEVEEKGVYFNESVWNGIYSDVEKYFPDLAVSVKIKDLVGILSGETFWILTQRVPFWKK